MSFQVWVHAFNTEAKVEAGEKGRGMREVRWREETRAGETQRGDVLDNEV